VLAPLEKHYEVSDPETHIFLRKLNLLPGCSFGLLEISCDGTDRISPSFDLLFSPTYNLL